MANNQNRRGGTLFVQLDGDFLDVKGNWTYNHGEPKREAIVGADNVHGYKETPQVPFIEGEITDSGALDVVKLKRTTNATVTLQLANGKTFVLRQAWYAGEGNVQTEEGNIAARFEGMSSDELPASS